MLEYEKYLLDPSTMVLPGRLHDYVFYSVPMSVTEFPMTINVKLNWKVKDGYQAQDNDFYTVTLVEAYGVSTNTNQNFATTSTPSNTPASRASTLPSSPRDAPTPT